MNHIPRSPHRAERSSSFHWLGQFNAIFPFWPFIPTIKKIHSDPECVVPSHIMDSNQHEEYEGGVIVWGTKFYFSNIFPFVISQNPCCWQWHILKQQNKKKNNFLHCLLLIKSLFIYLICLSKAVVHTWSLSGCDAAELKQMWCAKIMEQRVFSR